LKLVVDAGNGVAGPLATRLFKALGCTLVERFTDIDGTFPNHHPDPAHPENLQDVIQALKDTDAELGFAFDGDGDRLGVVTKDGQIIFPDRQLMLFAEEVLSRNPGAQIIYDVKCTRHL
ncbi:phosphomannomutase/phosphoglucomutase, partial [Burkholderia sp. Bp8990]